MDKASWSITVYFVLIALSYVSARVAKLVAISLVILPLLLSLTPFKGGEFTIESVEGFFSFIDSPFNPDLRFIVDLHTTPFLILVSFLASVAIKSTPTERLWLSNSFLLSGVLSACSANMFLFLIFFEASSVFLFLTTFFANQGKVSALRFLKYSVFSFAAIICGSVFISNNNFQLGGAMIWLGIAVKAPLPPFNSWQLAAYGACSPFSVIGMSALLSKLPLLILTRFVQFPSSLADEFCLLTTFTSLVAALNIYKDDDRIRRLAYLSSLHIGIFLAALLAYPQVSSTVFGIFALGHGVFLGYLLYELKTSHDPGTGWLISVLALLSQPLSLIFWVDVVAIISIYQISWLLASIGGLALVLGSYGILNEVTKKVNFGFRLHELYVWTAFFLGFFPGLIQSPPATPQVAEITKYDSLKDYL